MLQIITGKFFKSKDLIMHEGLGIAYSNLRTYQPIKTCIASLEPAGYSGSYVIKYINQIEKESGERQAKLVRAGDTEIIDQFLLLCMFGLRAFFAVDRAQVATNCRIERHHDGDRSLPGKFVPRFFDPDVLLLPNQIETFQAFISKVLSLRRAPYELTIRYLAALRDALEALNYNVDLAYSMIVYAMEALSQSAVPFEPAWGDYDPKSRGLLEHSFQRIDASIADEIKASLLQSSHLRLQQRFVSFVISHLSDSFFGVEAPPMAMGLRPSALPRALKNAYRMRSNFAHSLKNLLDQIRTPILFDSEMFFWEGEPYIMLRGLLRIAEEVIRVYVNRQESVDHEDFAWRSNLPGVITLEMAPMHWVWRHEGLIPEHAHPKLRGLLEHFEQIMQSPDALPDLRELMAKYEVILPQSVLRSKRAMLAAYWLYNASVVPAGQRPGYEKVLDTYRSIVQECSPENLAVYLILHRSLPWPADDSAATFRTYQAERFNPRNVRIPRLMELSLMAEIAKMYLNADRPEQFEVWMKEASMEASGLPDWQNAMDNCRRNRIPLDWLSLFDKRPKSVASPATANSESPPLVNRRDLHDATERRAYELWERRGRPTADDQRDWYEAERRL